jgi:hypothetical protein
VNASYINHGLKKNVKNIQMKGGRLKCSDNIGILIYLLAAVGLSPGGSTHLHTNNT